MTGVVLVLLAVVAWPGARALPGWSPDEGRVVPRRWRGSAPTDVGSAAEFAELLSLGVRAGLPLPDALALARELAGTGPPEGFLASAMAITDRVGAPVAAAAEMSARTLRARSARESRRASLLAGPRASMWVLTALPVVGPVAVTVLGLAPGEVYAALPGGVAALGGLVLTALGWITSRAILTRASRPTMLHAPRPSEVG